MKNLTETLEEAVGQFDSAGREDLIKFVRTYSTQFEAAAADEKAVEDIIAAAVGAESISPQGAACLQTAVKTFFGTDKIDPQPVIPVDAGDQSSVANNTVGVPSPYITASQSGAPADTRDSTPSESEQKLVRRKTVVTSISGGVGGLVWLLTLYVVAAWVAIGSLSSIQFRDEITQKHHTTYLQVMDLTNLDGVKRLQEELDQYREVMRKSVAAWDGDLAGVAIALGEPIEKIKSVNEASALCKNASDNIIKPCETLKEVLPKYLAYTDRNKALQEALANAKDTYAKSNGDDEKKKNEFAELGERIRFMRTFGYTPMLVMPDQVLTLLLAMAMGVLGSTITMTWTFLEEDQNPSVKWYLLRPFVGALSALVIFIFAKAGQMTLTVNAGDVNLSPFLLSLLGIASGLLSDRAYAQMSSVSGRFIGEIGAEKERWSSHLQEELNKKQLTSDQLATALNLDKERSALIVIGEAKVSAQEQQRIGDFLNISPRLLFTDIPPEIIARE